MYNDADIEMAEMAEQANAGAAAEAAGICCHYGWRVLADGTAQCSDCDRVYRDEAELLESSQSAIWNHEVW